MFCNRCGSQLPTASSFCQSCGTPLPHSIQPGPSLNRKWKGINTVVAIGLVLLFLSWLVGPSDKPTPSSFTAPKVAEPAPPSPDPNIPTGEAWNRLSKREQARIKEAILLDALARTQGRRMLIKTAGDHFTTLVLQSDLIAEGTHTLAYAEKLTIEDSGEMKQLTKLGFTDVLFASYSQEYLRYPVE
jgi:zinc-ribbon domain